MLFMIEIHGIIKKMIVIYPCFLEPHLVFMNTCHHILDNFISRKRRFYCGHKWRGYPGENNQCIKSDRDWKVVNV